MSYLFYCFPIYESIRKKDYLTFCSLISYSTSSLLLQMSDKKQIKNLKFVKEFYIFNYFILGMRFIHLNRSNIKNIENKQKSKRDILTYFLQYPLLMCGIKLGISSYSFPCKNFMIAILIYDELLK